MRKRKRENPASAPHNVRSLYFDSKLTVFRRNIYLLILFTGLLNLLLLFPDLSLIHASGARISVAIMRAVYFIILAVIVFNVKSINSFSLYSHLVTLCELIGVGIFLFVFFQYDKPDFLIQTLGLVTIVLIVFLIPNRIIFMLLVSVSGSVGFFICALSSIKPINMMEYTAAITYVGIAIVLCSIFAYNSERHQFREFLAKRELERISTTDFLTSAANRMKLSAEAERWLSFCKRQNLPLSLVFFDVDNMKEINDRFGHPAGDSLLANVARLIQSQLRSSDVLARWGGDEFIILLPNVSFSNAVALSKRMDMNIRENISVEGNRVSCSFGVVEMKKDSAFDELVKEADSLMYKAKQMRKAHHSK